MIVILGGTFLVFAVGRGVEPFGPAVTVVEVKCTEHREVLVISSGVSDISDKRVNPVFDLVNPFTAEVLVDEGRDGGSLDMIPPVEMVVVIVAVTEITSFFRQ